MRIVYIFLFFSLLFSCKKTTVDEVAGNIDEEKEILSQYFDAATSGVVSSSEPLNYILKTPLSKNIDDNVLQSVISLEPKVKGKVSLANGTVLSFAPEKPMQNNTMYAVTVNLPALDKERYSKVIQYKFQTLEQQVKLAKKGFVILDNGETEVVVDISSADKLDVKLLENCFSSKASKTAFEEKETLHYSAKFTYTNTGKANTIISFDGAAIHADSQEEIQPYELDPGKLYVVHSDFQPESKEVQFFFSKIIDNRQALSGLLSLAGLFPDYSIHQNVLTLFVNDAQKSDVLNVLISNGLKARDGSVMEEDFSFSFENRISGPAIDFVSSGNYFPSEGEFKIPIKSRNLTKAKVVVIEIKQENVLHFLAWHSLEYSDYYSLRMYGKPIYDREVDLRKGLVDEDGWTVYGLDLSTNIKKNPGSIYHVSMDYLPEHTTLSCKSSLEKYRVQYATPSQEYFYSKTADMREEYYYYEDYSWEKNQDPCNISYYAYKQPSQRLLICSDYSIIAKKAGNNYHVAVNTLRDLKSVSGADVSIYDLQAEKTGQSTTAQNGMTTLKGAGKNGVVLKISKDKKTTYLSLDESDSNPLTEYDISGELSEKDTEIFTYTERNVWRPGDSIYCSVMLNVKNAEIPDGLPLVCSFVNPDNVQIQQKIIPVKLNEKQIYSFVFHTSPSSKTGRYRWIIKWGTKTLRRNLQIETIKPNTTETIFDFEGLENNVVYNDFLKGSLKSQYLTGFAAGNTKVKAVGKYYLHSKPFPDFSQYSFTIPGSGMDGNVELFDLITDREGNASFSPDYDFKMANGPGNLQIEIESIIEGGGSNKEGKSIKMSPFTSYIGAERKLGSAWAGNHTFKENIEINLIRLDKKGKVMTASQTVNYTIYKHIEHWWIDKYRLQNWGNFKSDEYWSQMRSGETNLSGKGVLKINKGSLAKGAYKVVMEDGNSGHKTAVFFSVYDGLETIPGKEAHLLELVTEKDEYNAGESISMLVPEIAGAKALISIERGKEIIEQFWYDVKGGINEINIKTNENWAPNAYIHVTMVQPYTKSNNDFPMRLYGVKSIKLNGKTKPLTPVIAVADIMESDKSYSFSVSEQSGRAMEYTYSLVDEGLLSLKGFKTPDPYSHFNAKYPLLVKTWDIYKYLMTFFSGQFAGVISIGGDDAYKADALQEVNRFKPVVIHKGSFKVKAKGKNKHTIEIPRYIGKLRMMIVACNPETTGSAEKMITVKNPVMVQSNFPRSLNVTDNLRLPIQLFRDEAKINSVVLTSKMSNALLKGLPVNKNLSFGNEKMKKEFADIQVLNKPGTTTIEMSVSGGGKSMVEKTEIAVQYPNAYSTSEKRQVLAPGQKMTIETKPTGYPETFRSQILVSGTKAPDFVSYAEKLIEYPYGCLEQLTSNGFGQLYLDKLLDVDPSTNKQRVENLKMVVHKIGSHQRAGGSFYYWDNDYYHAWSDMYAGHFLMEMKNAGYLPKDNGMLQSWLSGQFQKANQWSVTGANDKNFYESEALSHTYRLYILAKAGKPAKSAMNRFMTTSKAKNPMVWWLLAGSFAHAGFDSKAKEIMAKAEALQTKNNRQWDYYSFGSEPRDLALIVEILAKIEGQKSKLDKYYEAMVDAYNKSSWLSTQDKGFACIATYAYYGGNLSLNKDIEYSITGLSANQNYKHSAGKQKKVSIEKSFWNKKVDIKNTGKTNLYINHYTRFIKDEINLPAENKGIKLVLDYYNLTQKRAGLENMQLGDDIKIVARVINQSALEVPNMALNLVMPSCFELINPRLYQTQDIIRQSSYIYQDYRDDRVYTFFTLPAGASVTYEWKAKASFTGDFYFPRTVCENMYNGNIFAGTASSRVRVK